MKKRNMFLIAGGAVLGAVAAKLYYDHQKVLTSDYRDTMSRLEDETDFEYSPEFKRELKRESIESKKAEISHDKSHYDFKELLNKLESCKAGFIENASKAEAHIHTLMAKHGLVELENFVDESEFVDELPIEMTPTTECPVVETVDVSEATDVLDSEMSAEENE